MAGHDTDVRFVSPARGPVTVGVDVGTTSVKALAVDENGAVVARTRVPHAVETPAADRLQHDAGRAWRRGPKVAFDTVTAEMARLGHPVAGVTVAAMVPSLTAVNRRGVPVLPGLLYGDVRGRSNAGPDGSAPVSGAAGAMDMRDAEGFLRWAAAKAPDAAGYWPCQAVATHAIAGVPAIDTAMVVSLGPLQSWGTWNSELLGSLGVRDDQLPVVVGMAEAGGAIAGTDAVFTGGTVDALGDQIVSGAVNPGDVLAIFGATLVIWIVTDEWIEVPDLVSVPHTFPGRVLVGGPSNAGALFCDWARGLLRGIRRPGPAPVTRRGAGDGTVDRDGDATPGRVGDPSRVPVWLPYLRGERVPFNDPSLRASLHSLDISQGPAAIERAAFEASGFVIRRVLELSGLEGRRVVASGGGTRVAPWMAAVADATGLPVDAVAVPEGAALGAAYMARMAAGLESSLDDANRWARTGGRTEPDPAWTTAASERYALFRELGPGR
jgi:xylulokinase